MSAEETSAETAPVETETAVETSESVDNAETLAQDEGNASQVSETGSIEDNYFTAQDGLLKINTNGHVGYYLFNEDGYLVTGRMTREPGAAGYTGTQKTEWYFLENSKASCIRIPPEKQSHRGHPILASRREITGYGQELFSAIIIPRVITNP